MSASSSETAAPAGSLAQAADRLWTAHVDGRACDPVAPLIGSGGIDAAYVVQQELTRRRIARGGRLVGRKIGLTSAAVQRQLGVDRPDYGALLDDMAFGDRDKIPAGRLIQPKIEGEVAFVLERDLRDVASLGQVISAIAYALPAIEIVDSRVRNWAISIVDTIADNASSGLFVLGGTPRRIDRLDLGMMGMVIERRGEPVSVGCGATCLGNPLNALLWLARVMDQAETPLRAGDIVLSGALGPMIPVDAGQSYTLRLSGLGSVTTAFEETHK